jgi:hypothetical protein
MELWGRGRNFGAGRCRTFEAEDRADHSPKLAGHGGPLRDFAGRKAE